MQALCHFNVENPSKNLQSGRSIRQITRPKNLSPMTDVSVLGKTVRRNNKNLMEDIDNAKNPPKNSKNNDPNTITINITKDDNGATGIDLFSVDDKRRMFLYDQQIALLVDLGEDDDKIKAIKRQKLDMLSTMMQGLVNMNNSSSNTSSSSSAAYVGAIERTPNTTTTNNTDVTTISTI